MKKTKEEILADEIINNPIWGEDKKLYIHCDIVLNLMQTFADQETSELHTRAQMIEFGEKVKMECLKKADNIEILCGDAIRRRLKDKTSCGKMCACCDQQIIGDHCIQSINIESLLQKEKK
jgi:hypothetical protein